MSSSTHTSAKPPFLPSPETLSIQSSPDYSQGTSVPTVQPHPEDPASVNAAQAPAQSAQSLGTLEAGPQELPQDARARCFSTLGLRDIPTVGGKNASLGELTRSAHTLGIRVPPGFAIPAAAFRWYLECTGLDRLIQKTLQNLDANNLEKLRQAGTSLRQAILGRKIPAALGANIVSAYRTLQFGPEPAPRGASSPGIAGAGARMDAPFYVAVRSSATAEDLPQASFAGAQESFLNITGETSLIEACHKCFASLYTDRAISYRFEKGFANIPVSLSVGVQKMVDVSQGASGVLFTLDTETGCRDLVLINAVHGLGEPLVQGKVTPDEYLVFKPTLESAPCAVIKHTAGPRDVRTVPISGGGTREEPVPETLRSRPVLGDALVLKLAKWGCAIESHYSAQSGVPTPMDIEWAWDGGSSEPAILQARPETVHSRRTQEAPTRAILEETGRILVQGTSIGTQIAHGKVRILRSPAEHRSFSRGDILVAERTDPDWEPVMRLAAGIITERGGRTCHAAIVSRELGIPAIVGAKDATRRLSNGQPVTLSCAQGACGSVFEGHLKFRQETVPGRQGPPLKTKLLLNMADPGAAFRMASLPADGVGLIREEFLLAGEIGIHPLALLQYDTLNAALRRQIEALTQGYPDKKEFFISKLAEGVGQIAAAFFPKPVLLRFSDLKTNEYAHLVGGAGYEDSEENPMLGFRGASRYCDKGFREAFALECEAARRVRETMGLNNLRLMVPFCRTPEEGARVLQEMELYGLARGRDGLQVWMMCEIPSNVLLAEEFCSLFDGFSIGSNDLTQLTLGVDRDASRLAHLFDERNPAVKSLITEFIKKAHAAKKPVGICGQAPSDYPEFAQFLVKLGIDSISLEPDALLEARETVARAEAACVA